MIKIYDINDKLLMQAEVTSAAKREQEMSKSDYISLSFSAAEKVILPVGAYINYTYKIDKVREVTRKFLLLESYEPTQSDECSWKYTPQFQHPKMILSKTPFFIYTRNSQNVEVKQNVWSFVGTTSALSEKIKDFLNKDLMFGECGWKVIFSNVTANTVNVSFSDNDFISALTAITNAIGDNCEWHIDYDDEIIYIGKVLIGATPVVLEVGKNVGVPSINNSKEGYYNAFSIFGGTRNITQVNSKGENVSSGDIRLQLDEGNGTMTIDGKECSYSIDKYSTLDLRADKTKEPLFTKVLDFSQIFPSLNTYVYNVRGRVKYVLDDNNKKIPISYNADGSVKEYKTFTVWYMKLAYPTTEKVEGKTIINTTVDDGVTHYWYDFEVTDDLLINGKNIGCSFEPNFNTGALSTPLAGRGSNGEYVGFELIYHKKASSSHTSDDVSDSNFSVLAGDYEIIYQEDNEVIIPTNKEEMLIPRGERLPSLKCNITVLYNIAMADTIYYEDAQNRLLEKAKEEIVRLLSDLNNYEVKSYSDVFLEDNPQLQIGQSITYKDGHGYELATRVLKLSTNIDYDFIQSITIGNQVIKGTITQLKEDVQTIIASGGSSGNGGGYSVSQLRKLIAKYGSDNFISKQFDDIAKGTITWEKLQKFLKGMKVGANGDWTLDERDNTHLTTDYLQVRMKAIFETLEILHTDTLGGELFITPVGSNRILKVEEANITYDGVSQKAYRCYFLGEQDGSKVENKWKVGDQARSKSFNLTAGKYHNVGNHYYWRLVIGVSSEAVEIDGKKYHYVDLSDIDKDAASDEPMVDDILNQCGNRTDVERQNCLIFSAVDTYSPSISLYHGINSYSFANREYVEYGVNKQNNKAFFNVYGDMYVGDRPTKENGYEGSSYIRYDSSTKQLSVKGKISAKSTVDGKELSQYFNKIAELQNQVDGAIETWFYDGVPTLENAPAISWKTDKDKEIHLGDLYYNNKTGKAYRFAKDSNTYKWTIITDTDIAKALSDARMAQETANGKMKVFSVQPTTPYQVGDIWVNATYPSDGSTYKNEVLRCQTNKAAGSQFAIGDWIKASKYTDDTVANAAKKAAEDAQKAAQTAQTDIKNLGNTVTDNKKEFDNYVTDGYLEPSEIAAMAQDSKRLEDDFAAAQKSYNEVKNAEVLANTKELTDLNTAFATLTSAKTELVTYLSDISKRYNETDTNGKAAIVSAVGTKFTNFQSAYSAFYDKLGLANAYITSKIYGDLQQNITDLAGYKYLKDALGQTTDIDGGLVMTTLLALRDGDGNVQSGINGAIDPNRGKKSIATWWGGQMVDKDYNSGNLTPATSLIRFDGSGYLANGAIWWDVSGKVHADPTSFIISEENLGAYLIFFEPTWKAGSAGTSVADLVSLKPNAPFSKLGVSGDATFEGAISFHGIKLTYDSTNKAIKIDGNLYATGGITAYGAGASTTGGCGLIASVISYARILEGSYTDADLTSIPNAYAIKALSSRIDNIATELGGLNLSWNNITGKPSTFAPSAHTHKWTEITDRITKVSQLTNDAGYLTAHQSLASYYTKAEIDAKGYTTNKGTVTSVALTLPTGLACATKTITTSGTFAVTFASGYSIPTTTKQTAWDGAVSAKHTHSNKSVLDGISSAKVTHWDSAYDWYALMTTDEETADGIINKWNEVVSFLANIAQTDTLSGIVDGINKSISDEVTRAKKAEGVNASGISTNKTNITTLQGYFTNGSAKKALQLTNARKFWGNSFNGTSDINGSIIVPNGKYISIGNIKMEYDATNKALKITNTTTNEVANLYTSGGVSAYGVGTSSSSGGGLNGSVKSYSNALKLTSESLSEIASAYSIKALDSRISSLEGGSATAISVSGSGNAVTSVTKNGTTISVVKGSTFLTSHQSLDGYATQSWVKSQGYLTSHQDVSVLTMANDRYYTAGLWGINMRNSDIIGVNSIYTNDVSEEVTEAILFCRSNGNYDGIRAVNGELYFSNNVVRTTGKCNGEDKVYHTGNLTKLSQLTNDKNFVTGSVSGQTITINGVSTTWQNTWRGITDSYSGTSTGTSLSQKGANSLYNALHNGYASSAGNSDTVDGYHANGLLTALSNSNNGISITVGGTTKSISNISVNYASSAGSSGSASKVYGQVKDTGSHELVRCDMNSDQFRIIAGSSGNNKGWAEIATADDGNEPIYVRQYSGVFSSVVRTLTLLDANGYTHFPSYINIGGNENNNSSPDRVWGSNGSDSYLRSYRTSALSVANADTVDGVHMDWSTKYTAGNYLAIWDNSGTVIRPIPLGSVSIGNADKLDGYHESSFLRYRGAYEDASVTKDGVGVYGWAHTNTGHNNFHESYGDIINIQGFSTWRTRFDIGTSGRIRIVHGINTTTATQVGYLAYLHDNVASATKLQTPRTIWGQSFDGTGNVNGTIYINNSNSSNGAIRLNSDISSNARISAINDQVIFNTGNAIRFGETAWDWNQWAGLKYTHSNKTIYLGIADNSAFNANNAQSNGTLKFPGITTITPDSGARIGGSGGDLYLGNANNSNWVKVQDICSQTNSSLWSIRQDGNAYFKSIYSGAATINGNLSVTGLISNKGILPTNYEFNNKGTSCYVSADALCSGITAITDSIQVNQVTVQYSNDSGNSWTNYSMNNDAKFNLYASNAGLTQVYLGYNVITGNNDAEKLAQVKKNELIVSFYISNSCYAQPYFASVDISNGIDTICTVEILNNSGAVVETYTKHMAGWNQVNYISLLHNGNTGYGVGNNDRRYIRFKFKHDQKTTALRNTVINKIRIFSFTKYSFPTDRFMGHTGHIYNFDYNMNTYFPNSILAKGGVTAYQSSDIRLKTNITKLNCLNVIKSIGGTYEFDYIRDHKHSIGFIAQNVNNPLLKDIVAKDDNGYLKINYWNPKLISLAFGALTEIDDEVDKLKARVRELESEVEYLKNKDYVLQS